MEIIETEISPDDRKNISKHKSRGVKILIVFSLFFFCSSYYFNKIEIAVAFSPFCLFLLYSTFKKLKNKKIISIGFVTKKDTLKKHGDNFPKYTLCLDNEKEFDLFGIPQELYWENISVGNKIEIHESNGYIINIKILQHSD